MSEVVSTPAPGTSDTVLVRMTRTEAAYWQAFLALLDERSRRSPRGLTPDVITEVVRQREQVLGALAGGGSPRVRHLPEGTLSAPQPGECGTRGSAGRMCRKPFNHQGNHRYESPPLSPPSRPVVRDWERVESVDLESGSRTYALRVGNPCSLRPKPEVGGQVKHGFTVVSIERHPDGRVNVEIKRAKDARSRTVPLDRIAYKRPST